jgi:hypothetical protein
LFIRSGDQVPNSPQRVFADFRGHILAHQCYQQRYQAGKKYTLNASIRIPRQNGSNSAGTGDNIVILQVWGRGGGHHQRGTQKYTLSYRVIPNDDENNNKINDIDNDT